jgi:hypothetical protein
MANWYVDYVNGNDANAGTALLPKKTIQAAVNLATRRDVIHLADTGNHVLAGPLTWNTGYTNTGSGWLVFKSWNNGGSQTIQRPDETTSRVAALIDGTDTISGLLSFAPPPTILINLKLTNFTSYVADPFGGGPLIMYGCEVYGQSGTQWVVISRGSSILANNYIHSNTTARTPVVLSDGNTAFFQNNWVESSGSTAIIGMDNNNNVLGNIIKVLSAGVSVSVITNNQGYFSGNTIIANGLANQFVFSASTSNVGKVYNNVMYGFNGAGSKPFNMTGTSIAYILGRNAYYDCNTNTFNPEGLVGLDLTSEDIYASGDPFVDSANNDYRLNPVTGAAAIGSGLGNYNSSIDIGAVQSASGGGGGGSNIFIINE